MTRRTLVFLATPLAATLTFATAGCNALLDNVEHRLAPDASVPPNSADDGSPTTDHAEMDAAADGALDARVELAADAEGGAGNDADADAAFVCTPPSGTCTPPGECQQPDGVYVCDGGAVVCVSAAVQNGTSCGGADSGMVCSDGGCV
ncbi:MAG TPA: hypothetical protein VEK07_11770, partial [Polyangiaceae bacterium]|nr:hypothetical protein [Polyangiaceae bacterium]